VPVLPISAKTGQGFEPLIELLEQDGNFGRKILDIDYDIYAEGEAELGWLNSSIHVAASKPFDLDALLLEIVTRLQHSLGQRGLEVAHLKSIGLWEGIFGVANLVSSQTKPELSLPSQASVPEAEVIVNARVAADPELLEEQVRDIVALACRTHEGRVEFRTMQSFRPGRPQPTHRYAEAR
jgi:hypothetical protein